MLPYAHAQRDFDEFSIVAILQKCNYNLLSINNNISQESIMHPSEGVKALLKVLNGNMENTFKKNDSLNPWRPVECGAATMLMWPPSLQWEGLQAACWRWLATSNMVEMSGTQARHRQQA